MTDELTAEQEAAVRRLLQQARHEAPVPADVAARLDAKLDELVADEGADDLEVFEAGGSPVVTELAGMRRRRRNAGRLLLAAAAVIVGGVAVGQNIAGTGLDMGGGDSGEADTALAEPPRASAGRVDEESADSVEDGNSGGDAAPEAAPEQAYLLLQAGAPLDLTSEDFAADVQRELLRTADERRVAAKADYDGVAAYAQADPGFVCPAGPYGEGAKLPVYYDAEEAVLVLRKPRSGIQHVDLLTCGTAVTLNSLDLPAP
ncbi:hypothetical protein [Nocardioides dilutus]